MCERSSLVEKRARQNITIIMNMFVINMYYNDYNHDPHPPQQVAPAWWLEEQGKHERGAGADSYTVGQLASGIQHQVDLATSMSTNAKYQSLVTKYRFLWQIFKDQ